MDGILQQVQKDRAPKQRMDMLDILRQDVENQGGEFDSVYSALQQGVESGRMRIMRSGNTLMIYSILEPGVADVHIATADTPQGLIQAVKDFYQAMQKAGFRKAMSTTNNPQIGRVLQASGVPVQVSMRPSMDGSQEFDLVFGG